jgi:hypothetical protein
MIDGLHTESWLAHHNIWLSNLTQLLRKGPSVGLHVLLTAPDLTSNDMLHPIYSAFGTKIISRAIAEDHTHQIAGFHPSLLPFVDAILIEDGMLQAIELPVATPGNAHTMQKYWRKVAEERVQSAHLYSMGIKSGLTTLFQKLQKEDKPPSPPVPQPPSLEALAHAATVLSSDHPTQPLSEQTVTAVIDDEIIRESAEKQKAKQETTSVHSIVVETESITSKTATLVSDDVSIRIESIRRAHALASYLGWLGRGPLMDVLGMSLQEAEIVIAILQARQILERSDTPTPRLRSSHQR